jgi:hypothetical protein
VALPIIFLALAATTGGVAGPSAPRHARAALVWAQQPGAESCVTRAEVIGQVEEKLGRTVFVRADSEPAEFVLDGTVRATEQGFAATIVLHSADGTLVGVRELATDGPCSTLSESAVLAAALIIDLPTRPPEPPRTAPIAPSSFRLALGPVVASGVAGSTAWGLRLGLRLGPARDLWALDVATRVFAPVEHDKVSVWSADFSAAGCLHTAPRSIRVAGCAGLAAGWMRGRGSGLRRPEAATVTSADTFVRLELALGLGRGWSVPLGAEGRYGVRRPSFVYTTENGSESAAFEKPALSGSLDIAIAREF